MIKDILKNQVVIENAVMIIAVLVCFGMALLFGNKYNNGGSRAFLVLSRILIVVCGILIIFWLF